MPLIDWLRKMSWVRRRGLQFFAGRAADPESLIDAGAGITAEVRDRGLRMLCDAFGIPEHQMYCLRLDDDLMAIYKSKGPRICDEMEFEQLGLMLDERGTRMTEEQFLSLRTVRDVLRFIASRA